MQKANKMAYGGYRNDRERPKEFFKATCTDCGQGCEVPFKPTQGRPVYCRNCFNKHRPAEVDRSKF
jgi:CxxC-x17-CxxC domain-containing protein